MRRTIASKIGMSGVALHSGRQVSVNLVPGIAGAGVVFVRTDVEEENRIVEARWDTVSDTTLCTRISNRAGVSVSTIEHLMAALAGCGIDDATIEVDGPEVPVMDGSAQPFVEAIQAAGIVSSLHPLTAIRILRPVRVEQDGKLAELAPAIQFSMSYEIRFEDEAIATQRAEMVLSGDTVSRELADCRTFCRLADVEYMRSNGLARGGSLDNAVVVDGGTVLNPGGLRRPDEFVRHKMLDAVGDLALAGMPILGRYRGVLAGHGMTNRLLRALFADPEAWRLERVRNRAALLPNLQAEDLPGRVYA